MNQQAIVGCCAAVMLLSCGRSPFEGFKAIDGDVHFKLRMLGDGERLPTDSDSAFVRVRMALHGQEPGSLFSTERWYGRMADVLPAVADRRLRIHEGDSVSLVVKAGRVPWNMIGADRGGLGDTGWVDVELSLQRLRSREDSRRWAEALRLARTETDEDSTLARFFARSNGTWDRSMGVFYRLDPRNPKRPGIQSGQVVTIEYSARFLDDDRLFDDTHRARQPLTFRLGDPGQVIKGLEVALHLLPAGGKGEFIIPSALAFGPEGSSSKIVPPWTPVLYTVEVTDVKGLPAAASRPDSTKAL